MKKKKNVMELSSKTRKGGIKNQSDNNNIIDTVEMVWPPAADGENSVCGKTYRKDKEKQT